MRSFLSLPQLLLLNVFSLVLATPDLHSPVHSELLKRRTLRTEGGVHLPLVRSSSSALQKRGQTGVTPLGNYYDVTYNVLVTIGNVTTPLILDTGSSDTWVVSDLCTSCKTNGVALYPQASFQSTGLGVNLLYGDSSTLTTATGLIGRDSVAVGGLKLSNQYFSSINYTNTSVLQTGSAGLFGLGFPINSALWNTMFTQQQRLNGRTPTDADDEKRENQNSDTPLPGARNAVSKFPDLNFAWRRAVGLDSQLLDTGRQPPRFPDLSHIIGNANGARAQKRQTSALTNTIINSFSSLGPLISRMVVTKELSAPMFAVSLQRDTIEIGGNPGLLSIGELPPGLSNDDMTWTPLRAYTRDQGGLPAPPDSPSEQYPLTWEVFVDDVYFDGQKLPKSSLAPPSLALSALVDTGNSVIRGPSDIIAEINKRLGGTRFPCSVPHTLAFQIGGKMFPVDPLDFIAPVYVNSVDQCTAAIAATDVPSNTGVGYRYSWSLGDVFLKSVVSAYYFGDLQYPSRDQPRMGFLSTVPKDADTKFKAAFSAASAKGGFPQTIEVVPSALPSKSADNANAKPSGDASQSTTGSADALPKSLSVSVPQASGLVAGGGTGNGGVAATSGAFVGHGGVSWGVVVLSIFTGLMVV